MQKALQKWYAKFYEREIIFYCRGHFYKIYFLLTGFDKFSLTFYLIHQSSTDHADIYLTNPASTSC
jgi:hypothetical protein